MNEQIDEILSPIIDDNKLRPHERVAPGLCSCGFNAYSVDGIMLDYGDILRNHIDGSRKKIKAYEAVVAEAKTKLQRLIVEARLDGANTVHRMIKSSPDPKYDIKRYIERLEGDDEDE